MVDIIKKKETERIYRCITVSKAYEDIFSKYIFTFLSLFFAISIDNPPDECVSCRLRISTQVDVHMYATIHSITELTETYVFHFCTYTHNLCVYFNTTLSIDQINRFHQH
jgi:hypothetical protein